MIALFVPGAGPGRRRDWKAMPKGVSPMKNDVWSRRRRASQFGVEPDVRVRLVLGGAAREAPVVAVVDGDGLLAPVVVGGVVERELEREAAVVAGRAADGDGVAEALGDRRAARRAVDLEDAAVERVRGVADLVLIAAVADVDGPVVGLTEGGVTVIEIPGLPPITVPFGTATATATGTTTGTTTATTAAGLIVARVGCPGGRCTTQGQV